MRILRLVRHLGERFLRKEERVGDTLFERIARVIFQLIEREHLTVRQRMMLAYKNVDGCLKERREHELGIVERRSEHACIVPVDVENADVRAVSAHVLDDLAGGRLAHDEIVFLVVAAINGIDERTDAERVVLRGD